MALNHDSMKPIYVQIAEWLETEIISEHIQDDEKIYSQYQLADMFNINPATAGKSLNMLANENIVYKKRGLGMFVSPQAKQRILEKRKKEILQKLILDVVVEAERLGVSEDELITLLKTIKKNAQEGLE